jgi:hypothetical protein
MGDTALAAAWLRRFFLSTAPVQIGGPQLPMSNILAFEADLVA